MMKGYQNPLDKEELGLKDDNCVTIIYSKM